MFARILPVVVAALTVSCSAPDSKPVAAAPVAAGPPPARVVLVVIDTLRRDHVSLHGYPRPTTPWLDALAREGVVFDRAVSTSAWTAPATASLLTGLYPFQHGVVTGFAASRRLQRDAEVVKLNAVPREAHTIAETFDDAGYATFAVAQNVNLTPQMGFAQGFRRYRHQRREKVAEAVNERVLAWADRWRQAERGFLYLHYLDPHAPYLERPPLFDASATGTARQLSAYDSEIRWVDDHVAAVAEALGWDDALVIVTADHGEAFGEHDTWGHSQTLHAELTDVPLVVRFPDRRFAGRRVADRVSHVDVLPTLREVLGLPPDPGLPGRSLLPLLRGEPMPEREVFAHLLRRADDGQVSLELQAAWAGPWKWIGGSPQGPLLFDVDADPAERTNLAGRRPEIVRALQSRYQAFERSARRLGVEQHEETLDPERQEELRALGYVN